MSEELKPCPFCGGEARYNRKQLLQECILVGYDCEQCGAAAPVFTSPIAIENSMKIQAAEAWNRRAQQPNEPLTLEQLRQMDGESVWISGWNRYGILGRKGVDADDDGKPIYRYVVGFAHGWEWLDDVLADGRKAYVRPPEEGEKG